MSDIDKAFLKNGKAAEVLLVEDDNALRTIIAKNLSRRGLMVREAENGLVAKTIFELDPKRFDLIISDIRMPELDGVALLKIVRAAGTVPFIVMTGFSELIESKNAFELGASDFLPKPAKTEALLASIIRCLNPENNKPPANATEAKPKGDEFNQIHIDEFVSTTHLRSDIYLRLGDKFVKVAHKGDAVPIDRIRKYQTGSVEYLYVKSSEFRAYVNLNIQVARVLQQSPARVEAKLRVLKHTAEVITESCFRDGFDKQLFDSASKVVLDTVDLVADDEDILGTLTQMHSGANRLYVHAVAVSMFSAMIAKAVGWTSVTNQSKVSLCGLFHDIGKKEIDPAIFEKKRIHLTVEDIQRIESHVLRGRDILRQMPSLPEDVSEVAYQHHENFNGTGYPHALSGDQIHPMARLVRVADLYVSAILPLQSELRLEPLAALQKLQTIHEGEVDPTFVRGLAKVVRGHAATSTLGAAAPVGKVKLA
ncbi:hypothetical protein BH10BDE1_BH10BDE1_02070 [soil metagenome]